MPKEKDSPYDQEAFEAFAKNMGSIAARSQEIIKSFLQHHASNEGRLHPDLLQADPLNIGKSFLELTVALMEDPSRLFEAQMSLVNGYVKLWQNLTAKLSGQEVAPVASPATGDRRFKDADWERIPVFDYLKQSYLLTARWLQDTVGGAQGMTPANARKTEFYTRQFVDAMSPSNFLLTNPEALRETVASKGENLVRGLENLIADMERGEGQLKIRQTDDTAFQVGANLATTPGKVIFQNELIQLIQYAPTTKTVYRRPLLIVPPWINKFYILDLKPENSFIRWAVGKGYTVLVISWVNPDARLAEKSFEDYMREGVLAALDAVALATGETDITAIGYCIGGTLLASTLAYMAEKGDERIKAATFFTTQVDFSEPGELGVFIDEVQIEQLDKRMSEKGYMDAADMATTFNMLRANDLIWSFVVNNYLMGREPYPFDLLFWNSDATRLPRAMHLFYLREMYLKNRLVEPGGIVLDGVPIDLRRVRIPVYLQAGREDHIAPLPSVFKATRHFKGPVRFMIAGSGHIAGVINPPAKKKYQYWMNEAQPDTLEAWLEGAEVHPGSWWPDWHRWLSKKSGRRVPARIPGQGRLPCIEDAPGSYVKMK
jgi:polyhydroxyalkanoate synthase